MDRQINILLPDTIYIRKDKKNQDIPIMEQEYSIYFQNILQPYAEKWDVIIDCAYGQNLGHCWRLSGFTQDVAQFDLTLQVYDEYGQLLASKTSCIVPVERVEDRETSVLFLGDSMTHSQTYINHICLHQRGIRTVGSRSFDGMIHLEGRGGWSYASYYGNMGRWCSPFLFPEGVEAKAFYGSREFMDAGLQQNATVYNYYGFSFAPIREGQYFIRDGKLFRQEKGREVLIEEPPALTFDFSKYLEKYDLEKPEIVSVLMGANDLHAIAYEDSERTVNAYIDYTHRLLFDIRKCDPNIKIIVNMPVVGAQQYRWGIQYGCGDSGKRFRFQIQKAAQQLITHFDNRQDEGIYLCPMLACLDPENGFPYTYVKENLYSENMRKIQNDWVHPNASGYAQMGDALGSVIEYARTR